jgi:DNA-binding MarR family transcriptional regulator
MQIYSKIIFNLFHDELYKNNNKFIKFILRSNKNLILILLVHSEKYITLEELSYKISKKIISRSTLQNILKAGIELDFFEKFSNTKDKRNRYYRLTNNAKETLDNLLKEQTKIFKNLVDVKIAS